jgi:hypothetical protein
MVRRHPIQTLAHRVPWLSFASYAPGSACLDCHRRGPVPLVTSR